jgi:integrase/recombinase XerD
VPTREPPIALSQDCLGDWTVTLLAGGASPATAVLRQRGVRRFSAWLASKALISSDEIERFKPPKHDEPVVPALTDAQLRALLAICKRSEVHHVRDRALILFMAETAARASSRDQGPP